MVKLSGTLRVITELGPNVIEERVRVLAMRLM
jgi:hypothetical protein